MDLDALDTAYGAEQIDSDLLLTDIRTGLEYALRNKTYCGQDPFGKRRYGADAGDMCYVFGKEHNILKLVINIALDGGYGINPLPRDVAAAILRDVSAAIKPIANKHSARAIIKKQPFCSAAMGARSGALFQSAALYGYIISTPYAKDTGIPDEKIIWDANRDIWCKRCGQIRDTRFAAGQKTDYTIQPSDFGKVFLLGGSLYRIIGMGENSMDEVLVQGVDGQDKGDTVEISLPLVEHALYLAEMQNVSVSRDVETAFYENKKHIQALLDRVGVDVMYREMFELDGFTYALVGIIPTKVKDIFGAVRVDESGETFDDVLFFSFGDVIEAIRSERDGSKS